MNNEKIEVIKNWLGTGSINIFGLPMSGKDTVGVRLAEDLGAKFLSSGMMIRAVEQSTGENITGTGLLTPTSLFYDIVLPYFSKESLKDFPLVLSSVGRWDGEQFAVTEKLEQAGHETKVVVWLELSEEDVMNRREEVVFLKDRGQRNDDGDLETFKVRLNEFSQKTFPVLMHYDKMGILVKVPADKTREEVYQATVDAIYNFAKDK